MKYRDPQTGEFKDITVKVADTLPVGTIVEYDGDNIPNGWELVDGSGTYKKIKKTETITATNGNIVDSLAGSSTKNAPSINAVNNKFKETSTYSTEEKVIGTWDDGKPRYRKCFLIKNSSQINENNIIGRISNIDLITNIFGTMNVAGYITPLNSVWNDADVNLSVLVQVQTSNGDIILNLKSTVPRYPIFIAIEYTKTTDSATNTTEVINDEPILEEPTI